MSTENISFRERVNALHSLLSGQKNICIAIHARPDGDALGCSSAMYGFIRTLGEKNVCVVSPDPSPANLLFVTEGVRFLSAKENLQEAGDSIKGADVLICMDMSGASRADILSNDILESNSAKVLIDHHQNPQTEQFSLIFSETEISSACELTYRILLAMPGIGKTTDLPLSVLTSLMTGMTTDTNNFDNSVFPSTLAMASDLLAAGVDRDGILLHIYNEFRENRLRAMGYLLSKNMRITPYGAAYMILDEQTYKHFDLKDGETESFVNIPLALYNVRLSIFLKQDGNVFRVSVRSKRGTSALRIARDHFNGGGHECASGGRLSIPEEVSGPEDAASYIEKVTARFLQKELPAE